MQVRSKDSYTLNHFWIYIRLNACILNHFPSQKLLHHISLLFFLCVARYSSRNLSSPIKANLHFSLSRNGILSLDRADAVIEISEWVEVPKKNLTVENTTTTSPNITLETDTKNTTEESDEKSNSDGVTDNTSINITEELSTTEPITEKKLKKRTFRVPLKVQTSLQF